MPNSPRSTILRRAVGLCLVLLLYAQVPAALADVPVPTFTPYYFGDSTSSTVGMALGDLNGDGALDIVQANENQPGVIYWNDGHGQFGQGVAFAGALDTYSVAVGDLNGDGALDIVQGNIYTQSVVYLNDGQGGFGTQKSFGGNDCPRAAATGDLNGDGALDVVFANCWLHQSMIYLNDGHGGLTAGQAFGPAAQSRSVALGDLNGDGALDIVLGIGDISQPQQSLVFLNDGTGHFGAGVPFGNVLLSYSLALGDVNGDGALDIVQGNDNSGPGWVYLNDGTGHFGAGAPFGMVREVTSLTLGDVNSDGALDIIAGYSFIGSSAYLNDGHGGFGAPVALGGLGSPYSLATGDVNGDGILDVVHANRSQLNVVYFSNGIGMFSQGRPFGSVYSTAGLALGDLNGDGAVDLVQANYGQPGVVYLNDGSGFFGNGTLFGDASYAVSIALGDVNGDGALDVVQGFSKDATGHDAFYLNDGTGHFGAAIPFGGGGTVTRGLAVGDLNGDGALDIVQGPTRAPLVVNWNNGQGVFTASGPFGDPTGYTYALALGDLNGDGALDIVRGNYNQVSVIYLNDGQGGFGPEIPFGIGNSTVSVAVGDLNGDGALDIVQGNNGQPSLIYFNDGQGHFGAGVAVGDIANVQSLALGDVNGDGALDIVQGNAGQPSLVYLNDGAGQFGAGQEYGSFYGYHSVAVGDVNGDGMLDVVQGYSSLLQGVVYANTLQWNAAGAGHQPVVSITHPAAPLLNANFVYASPSQRAPVIPITYTVSDFDGDPVRLMRGYYSPDGGGKWYTATASSGTLTTSLAARRYFETAHLMPVIAIPDNSVISSTLVLTAASPLTATDVNAWVVISHSQASQLRLILQAPTGVSVTLFTSETLSGPLTQTLLFDDLAPTAIVSATSPYSGTYRPATPLAAFNGVNAYGAWRLLVQDTATGITGTVKAWGLQVQNSAGTYVYNWDVFASGFFGQSDNVVFRLEAHPSLSTGPNGVPVFQHPYASATTFPFRARGTQVQVISGTTPISNAIVYRLPAGQQTGGDLIRSTSGGPFHTDSQGYLIGRGQINPGDRLLALAPVFTSTQGYTLYYTNGTPQNMGVDAYTVSGGGLQVITVTAQHPLYLFDLDVSLEWDAHNDAAYLDQLTANLQRTSQYLYDFTNGQAALGDVYVYQNTAGWDSSHITLHANNRLRPFAIIGGIVLTNTVDPDHHAVTDTVAYGPGQVTIGSTWNRYGRPGQMLSDDWSIILAHELSHYLFYEEDVYLGQDAQGNLIPVDSCTGSAMGDLYDRPQNTEFIFNQTSWSQNCGTTLAAKILGRTEWQTLRTWYPPLIAPSVTLTGPSEMPFNLTTVSIFDPLTPTATLVDPTFYVNYVGTAAASSDARAYLQQSDAGGDWLLNLGSPGGGQSRIVARGAKPGDRLCVFDSAQRQYGCEAVVFGNDQLPLTYDPTWNPVLQITPVNSTTLGLRVSNVPTTGLTLQARLFPDRYYAPPTVTLALVGNVYSGTFSLPQTGLTNGNVQVWASGRLSETIMAYSVGGNLGGAFAGGASRGSGGIGASRGSGGIGASRGSGGIGASRGSGGIGASRGSGGIGQARSGHAPLLSPDGQMIFFTNGNTDFDPGELFAIQATAGLPALPPGRTQVGAGYNLVASPGITLPAGSISRQYLSNDVTQAGANETELALYFYNGTVWTALSTTLDTYFDQAVAPSQGAGLYALLASIQIPLPMRGWNIFGYPLQTTQPITTALASIAGQYRLVYNYDMTDPADPWKVYTPAPIPGYVVDLHELRFAQAYWISTTLTNTTLYLAPAEVDAALGGLMPPTTFYGVLSATTDFTPSVGQRVEAVVNGLVCGQGATQAYEGSVVYVVDVNGDSGDAFSGCGQLGAGVTFYVNGRRMGPVGVWNNANLAPLDLAPTNQQAVYLPLVKR